MNSILLAMAVVASLVPTVNAVLIAESPANQTVATDLTPNVPTVVARDSDRRIWQTLSISTNKAGAVLRDTNVVTEIGSGLNVFKNGSWVEANDIIEVLPNGTAVATQTVHQVVFSANINANVGVRVRVDEANLLKTHVLGIAYYDFKKKQSVLVAELKDSIGTVVGQNRVVYADAFDGVKADIRYTNTKQGVEQDIILRERPPLPQSFGFDPRTTWIEVWTEFIDAPKPVIEQKTRPKWRLSKVDKTITFGKMTIGGGIAFDLDADGNTGIQVQKHWNVSDTGRTFLIEEVPFRLCAPSFRKLPERQQASIKTKQDTLVGKVSGERILPARVADAAPIRENIKAVAMVEDKKPGWVLDYSLVQTATNFTFQGDQTYLVSGLVYLNGTTTFEGGTVVKFTNFAFLNLFGDVDCRTEPYRPAVFTSSTDNSVGETLYFGTNGPSRKGNGIRIFSGDVNLHDVHIRYLTYGINAWTGASNLVVRNAQFSHCQYGLSLNTPYVHTEIDNVLAHDLTGFVNGQLFYLYGQHLTLDHANYFGFDGSYDPSECSSPPPSVIFLTNSLITAVPEWGVITVGFTNATEFIVDNTGIYKSVAAGDHYLADDSPYRDIGRIDLGDEMLADLKKKTTFAPVYSAPTNSLLNVTVERDVELPDLGYHYDPLDWILTNRTLVSETLWITNGAAVGVHNSQEGAWGLLTLKSGNFISSGTALDPNEMVWCNTVQEGFLTNGIDQVTCPIIAFEINSECKINARFTQFSRMGGEAGIINPGEGCNNGSYYFKDSRFSGNEVNFASYGIMSPISVALTNCLFERTSLRFSASFYDSRVSLTAFNNLFYGCPWVAEPAGADFVNGTLRDNFFYTNTFSTNSYVAFTNDHNAYITNYQRLSPNACGDVTLTNFTFLAGPAGFYYQPSNSLLSNAGSWAATNVGLYHFTTQTNQAKETNSIVDIGLHYVALDVNGNPVDTDGDGAPDYIEDKDGDGIADAGETSWNEGDTDGDGVNDYLELLLGRNPFIHGSVPDSGDSTKLRVFTPLK